MLNNVIRDKLTMSIINQGYFDPSFRRLYSIHELYNTLQNYITERYFSLFYFVIEMHQAFFWNIASTYFLLEAII